MPSKQKGRRHWRAAAAAETVNIQQPLSPRPGGLILIPRRPRNKEAGAAELLIEAMPLLTATAAMANIWMPLARGKTAWAVNGGRLRGVVAVVILKFINADLHTLRCWPVFFSGECLRSKREAELQRIFLKFLSDESGATAIEYGLIAAGIALAIIAVVNGLGTNLNDKFTSINNSLK
jgi:pilus assembly protein Flp/PilA